MNFLDAKTPKDYLGVTERYETHGDLICIEIQEESASCVFITYETAEKLGKYLLEITRTKMPQRYVAFTKKVSKQEFEETYPPLNTIEESHYSGINTKGRQDQQKLYNQSVKNLVDSMEMAQKNSTSPLSSPILLNSRSS